MSCDLLWQLPPPVEFLTADVSQSGTSIASALAPKRRGTSLSCLALKTLRLPLFLIRSLSSDTTFSLLSSLLHWDALHLLSPPVRCMRATAAGFVPWSKQKARRQGDDYGTSKSLQCRCEGHPSSPDAVTQLHTGTHTRAPTYARTHTHSQAQWLVHAGPQVKAVEKTHCSFEGPLGWYHCLTNTAGTHKD